MADHPDSSPEYPAGAAEETEAPSGPTEEHWDPGLPSLRSILPSVVGGAVVPLAVYYLVRSHVRSDADALVIAGIPAAIWVLGQFVRRRRIDPIGAIVLFGFVVGLVVSFAMGGNAFVLKVRDSAFTFMFGLASVVTTRFGRRPVIFYLGRALSAGSDPTRSAQYEELWQLPPARATFRVLGLLWGFGLMLESATRVVLAAELSTKSFLAVSPVATALFIGSMAAGTFALVSRSRSRAPLVDPASVPVGGGGTWWWLRVYLQSAPAPVVERQAGL